MSFPWKDWIASKAIDNIDISNISCNCCSGTQNDYAWWKLDLGNTYSITAIIFIGRSDCRYLFILCIQMLNALYSVPQSEHYNTFSTLFTCVTLAKVDLVLGPLCPSVHNTCGCLASLCNL